MGSTISLDSNNPATEFEFEVPGETGFQETILNIINDNETVLGALVGHEGLTYEDAEDGHRGVAGPVVVVATGRRAVFVTEDGRDVAAGTLGYGELASVQTGDGTVTFTTTDGVRATLSLSEDVAGEAPVSHLRWVGELRSRLVACSNDAELAAGEIRDHASAMEWEEARTRYEAVRGRLDRVIDAVLLTRPVPDGVLAPELTRIERTLERAATRLYIERADSERQLGRQLVESGEFGQAESVLGDARTYAERARSHAAAVERGDQFRFGEQRELYDDLEALSEGIEAVAAEPRRLATEAKERADAADDPPEAVEHLETALERYRDARALGADTGALDAETASVAQRLVDRHRELARRDWNEGADLSRDGQPKAAIRRWTDAVESLERAAALAREFDHEDVDAVEALRERVEGTLATMRETAQPAETGPDTPEATETLEDIEGFEADGGQRATDGGPSSVPATGTEQDKGRDDTEDLDELTRTIAGSDSREE